MNLLIWKRTIVPSLLLLVGFVGGCPSSTTLHTAKPTAKGDFQVSATATGNGVHKDAGSIYDTDFGYATIEGQVRYGVMESADIGVKLTTLGLFQIDFNYAFFENESLVLSVDPAISGVYFYDSDEEFFLSFGTLGLLADAKLSDSVTLTGAFKPGYWAAGGESLSGSASAVLFMMGGSLGAKMNLSESFAVFPEFSVMAPLGKDVEGLVLYAFALGLVFE